MKYLHLIRVTEGGKDRIKDRQWRRFHDDEVQIGNHIRVKQQEKVNRKLIGEIKAIFKKQQIKIRFF